MSTNFPKVVSILDKVRKSFVSKILRNYKALMYNQQLYSSNVGQTTALKMINFKNIVLIPVGADGSYDDCPDVGDYGDPCG